MTTHTYSWHRFTYVTCVLTTSWDVNGARFCRRIQLAFKYTHFRARLTPTDDDNTLVGSLRDSRFFKLVQNILAYDSLCYRVLKNRGITFVNASMINERTCLATCVAATVRS